MLFPIHQKAQNRRPIARHLQLHPQHQTDLPRDVRLQEIEATASSMQDRQLSSVALCHCSSGAREFDSEHPQASLRARCVQREGLTSSSEPDLLVMHNTVNASPPERSNV